MAAAAHTHPDKIFLTVNGRSRSLSWLVDNAAAATDVRVENCAGLNNVINAGKEERG